jgi:hypothetical protein
MTPAGRLREALAAVTLVGIRLHFHPDPADWIVVLGVTWALLAVAVDPRAKKAVLGAGVLALTTIYLKAHLFHMFAVASLLP